MLLHHGDKIVLKALNIPGLVCSKGKTCYFQRMEGLQYRCTLNYTDDLDTQGFLIKDQHILQAFDHLTNTQIYQDDLTDGF